MKYRVALEASAAIGIEMEMEADDENHAIALATLNIDSAEFRRKLSAIVEELLKPDPNAVEAYAKAADLPLTYVTVEEDENGFEVVDAFEPEAVDNPFHPESPEGRAWDNGDRSSIMPAEGRSNG